MALLQAYQDDLLKELDEGEELCSDDISELRRTADLSLHATKETASAIGRSMAAMVAAERHLWLTLSDMKDKDRVFLLDALLAPSGLFGDAVNSVVDRYQDCKQAAAFQRFLPRRFLAQGAAGQEQPSPRTSSSYREAQKESIATRAPRVRTEVPGDALGRGLRSLSRICGPYFRLRSPRPRSPDAFWPRAYEGRPLWGRAGTLHYTVPVSPQCPQEISLPTLPEFQGAAVSSERFSQFLPP